MPNPQFERWREDLVKDVTDEEIRQLSDQIDSPELKACFDQEPIERQEELAALFKMGYHALAIMVNSPERLAMTGVEAIRDRLNFLFEAVPEFHKQWSERKKKK